MQETAKSLREVIKSQMESLLAISEDEATHKTQPDKWSKKEILGHLIDSAANNQMKFVKLLEESEAAIIGYKQDNWVQTQKYQEANWQDLLTLWAAYNSHLAHIIEHTPEEVLSHKLTVNSSGPFTLEFIMKDYVEHLKHHLLQILPKANLRSTFKMVY